MQVLQFCITVLSVMVTLPGLRAVKTGRVSEELMAKSTCLIKGTDGVIPMVYAGVFCG